MLLKKKATPTCCSPPANRDASDCCAAPVQTGMAAGTGIAAGTEPEPVGTVRIDFLFLDLAVCNRCQGTDTTLDGAVALVSRTLSAAGYRVAVNKVHVNSEELAIRHRFVSSPTIRVNGRDIAMDVKESLCESCGDLCGDTVDCRVWTWQGKDYTQPPMAMVIDGILRTVYNPSGPDESANGRPFALPDNLKRFYASMMRQEKAAKDNATTSIDGGTA